MSFLFQATSLGLRALAGPARRRFEESLEDPTSAQKRTLERILRLSRHPWPERPTTWRDWNTVGPLTHQRALFSENTSGSGAARKSIPYNLDLLRSFRRMFLVWADDLLRNSPRPLRTGKTFISISPRPGENSGLEDDTGYLGPVLGPLMSRFLAVDPRLQSHTRSETFFRAVGRQLLAAEDLELCSIWSPTYFLALLDFIQSHRGEFSESPSRPELRRLLGSSEVPWRRVWPELRIISCWDSGMAARGARKLKELFPASLIQGKGLLATEAPMTVPLIRSEHPLPLWNEVYFEFLDARENLVDLTALREGGTYELAISTPGGLLRYRLGDRIQVSGFHQRSPQFAFVGRAGGVSDLVGEKLDAGLVQSLLGPLIEGPYVLLPKRQGYELLISSPDSLSGERADQALQQAHHYRLARDLRQLDRLEVTAIPNLERVWLEAQESLGLRAGDFKWSALVPDPERARRLRAAVDARLKTSSTSPSPSGLGTPGRQV